VNEIDANARQFANSLVVNVHGAQIFVFGVLLSADKERHNPDAIRKQANKIDQ
jgi:hypothetical protein